MGVYGQFITDTIKNCCHSVMIKSRPLLFQFIIALKFAAIYLLVTCTQGQLLSPSLPTWYVTAVILPIVCHLIAHSKSFLQNFNHYEIISLLIKEVEYTFTCLLAIDMSSFVIQNNFFFLFNAELQAFFMCSGYKFLVEPLNKLWLVLHVFKIL